MTTLDVREDELRRVAGRYPAVVSLDADADLPNRLAIRVVERPPVGLVEAARRARARRRRRRPARRPAARSPASAPRGPGERAREGAPGHARRRAARRGRARAARRLARASRAPEGRVGGRAAGGPELRWPPLRPQPQVVGGGGGARPPGRPAVRALSTCACRTVRAPVASPRRARLLCPRGESRR